MGCLFDGKGDDHVSDQKKEQGRRFVSVAFVVLVAFVSLVALVSRLEQTMKSISGICGLITSCCNTSQTEASGIGGD